MGKTFPIEAIIPAPLTDGAQKGYQALKTISAANSQPTTPGPAQPLTPSLTLPSSFGDATKRLQDAFTAVKVMKAVNDGNNSQVLSTLNRRQ